MEKDDVENEMREKGHKFLVSSGGGDPLYRCKSEAGRRGILHVLLLVNRKYLKTNTK